jgi:hypothetical protein
MSASIDNLLHATRGNPLLEALEPYLSTNDLEMRLQNWPLAGVDVANLSTTARHDFLELLQEEMFEPTLTSLDTTTRLYRMIRRGCIARDPTHVSARAHLMAVARFAGRELRELPWFPHFAKCMRVSGVTGLGKTYEVMRALKQLPPKFEHGYSRSADWTHMTQVAWLYIGMSHDGSLGGLLLQILVELDVCAGTGYSRERSLTGLSNEKLAVQVGIILNNHAVGVLVIDELQGRNFAGGARGGLAATFFLRMLNFGIPLVLMGNPLGMDALDSFSQDMRRVGSSGNIEMHPMDQEDFDYTDVLAPALWRYNVMPLPSEVEDKDGSILFQYCGGIRSYGARMRVASQRLALDQGGRAVTEEHMRQAFMGPDFSNRDRQLIAGFRDRNPLLLQNFDDVPWQRYAQRWGCYAADTDDSVKQPTASDEPATPQAATKVRKPVAQQSAEAAQRRRTRAKSQDAKKQQVRAELDANDMRNNGLQDYLITGMELLQKQDGGITNNRKGI